MKKLLSVFLLILIVSTVQAKENPDNLLKIKGKILDGYHAEIMLFKYDTIKDGWDKIQHLQNCSNYNFKLEPDENYYIVFTNNEGTNKIMCIDAGNTGMWYKRVDISFKDNPKYAILYQYFEEYNLKYTTKSYLNSKHLKLSYNE